MLAVRSPVRAGNLTCYYMLMLDRRLQILIDDERYRKLSEIARQRKVSVATVVREQIDAGLGSRDLDREEAGRRILAAEPMAVPSVQDLLKELDELRTGGL